MVILLRKSHILRAFSAIMFIGLSWGAFELSSHPMLYIWDQQGIVIRRVETNQKVVALTFDDGPVHENTSAVLDALQRNQAHATFFMLGERVLHEPELVRRMVRDGHELGNHSFSHADYNKLKTPAQMEDIARTNQAIKQVCGVQTRFFRPPGGYLSVAMVEKCEAAGMLIAYWTYQQDPKDWRNNARAASIARHIMDRIQPGQIIILHDGAPNGLQTAKSLDILIPELKKNGYACVTMSELLALENQ